MVTKSKGGLRFNLYPVLDTQPLTISNLYIVKEGGRYKITFDLNREAWVTGKVLSLMGREVCKIVDNVESMPGRNILYLDKQLPNGTYILTISAYVPSGKTAQAEKTFTVGI